MARCAGRTLLIRVNFILGTPADPRPALDSQVYEWDGGTLREVATFPTCGGTDVAVLADGDGDANTGRTGRDELPDPRAAVRGRHGPLPAQRGQPADAAGRVREPGAGRRCSPPTPPARTASARTWPRRPPGATEHDPLLVVTGTDLALYPGGGAAAVDRALPARQPGLQGTGRRSPTSAPRVATLARLRELTGGDGGGWRADAARLLDASRAARAANSTPAVARPARRPRVRRPGGRHRRDGRLLLRADRAVPAPALADPGYLTMASVRRDYLEGPAAGGDLPVPFNRVMIATFFLTGDGYRAPAHRLARRGRHRLGRGPW